MEIDLPSPRRSLWRLQPPPPPRGHPCPREEKSGEKNRGGDITPMRLRRRLCRQPRPTRPVAPARRDRQGPPRPTRPGRLRSARRPQAAQGSRARGAFVLSNKAAHDARALRADDELRPRRMDGASWSQIMCRKGRCVRRWRERVAQPKTAARTAANSLLPCPLLPTIVCSLLSTIARYCSASGGLSKCPRTVRRSRSASRRAPLVANQVSSHSRPLNLDSRSVAQAVQDAHVACSNLPDDLVQRKGPGGHDDPPQPQRRISSSCRSLQRALPLYPCVTMWIGGRESNEASGTEGICGFGARPARSHLR